jgi:hypothetical protein
MQFQAFVKYTARRSFTPLIRPDFDVVWLLRYGEESKSHITVITKLQTTQICNG